jgi:uncharacterized repeat protein (TIGR01451 family)
MAFAPLTRRRAGRLGRSAAAAAAAATVLAATAFVGNRTMTAEAASPGVVGTATTVLPLTSFSHVAVDDAHGHVFVSSAADNAIVVLDESGHVLRTISGEAGPSSMVLSGGLLYVALSTGGEIDAIDTGTLAVTKHLGAGHLTDPQQLNLGGGLLWTNDGSCSGSGSTPASVDPSSGAVIDYPNLGGLFDCPTFATDPADSDVMVGWDAGLEPPTLILVQVSGGIPSVLTSFREAELAAIRSVAFSVDGFTFAVAAGAPYEIEEFSALDLGPSGNVYPTGHYPNSVAISPATGLMAAGLNQSYPDNPSVQIYQAGLPANPMGTDALSGHSVLNDGLAFSGDGRTLFAISDGPPNATVQFNVLSGYPVDVVARHDDAGTVPNTPVVVHVLANDADTSNPLAAGTVAVATPPQNGTTSVNPSTGDITYTPNNGYAGSDGFVYTVCDTGVPADCGSATVTLRVTSPAGTAIPVDGYSHMVIDAQHNHLFVSSAPGNAVTVFDLSGHVVAVIGGEAGANGMVVSNGRLYVALTDAGAIDVFDTATLARVGQLATGLIEEPRSLAMVGGLLWTDDGFCGLNDDWPVSIDPNNGTTTLYTGMNVQDCPVFTPDPADDTLMLVWDLGIEPATINKVQVSNGQPTVLLTQRESQLQNLKAIAFAPNGATWYPASGYPYEIDEYRTLDLQPTGVAYSTGPYPSSVAVSAGNQLAGGIANSQSSPDVFIWQLGVPATTVGSGTASENLDDDGLAFSPDARSLYAASSPSLGTGVSYLDVITGYPVPIAFPDAALVWPGHSVSIDVLANDSSPGHALVPATVTVTAAPSHGTATVDATTGTITYTPLAGFTGTDTFTYQVCDNAVPANCGSAQVTVLVAESDLSVSLGGSEHISNRRLLVTYTATLHNAGPTDAPHAVLVDTLPAKAAFVSGGAGQGTCTTPASGHSGTVTCQLGTLVAGGTTTLTISIVFPLDGTVLSFGDTVTASSDSLDTTPADDTGSVTLSAVPVMRRVWS